LAQHHGLGPDIAKFAEPDALKRAGSGEQHEVLAEVLEARPYVRESGASPEPTVNSYDGGITELCHRPAIPQPTIIGSLLHLIRELKGRLPGAGRL
jgi:hypothetical protein